MEKISSKSRFNSRMTIKCLVSCSVCLALSYVLSFVKVFTLPFGGSVTLCSMFFVVYAGYAYGIGVGLIVAFVYGVLQFIQGPTILTFFQMCCDYFIAYTCLGLGGLFKNRKNGLVIGYIISIIGRASFHALGGYLYWMEYMPESFPPALAFAYPIIYNFSFILLEGLLTVIVISLPPVKKAISLITQEITA